jgi:hypothetical protein
MSAEAAESASRSVARRAACGTHGAFDDVAVERDEIA